jgi:hypothetical protein
LIIRFIRVPGVKFVMNDGQDWPLLQAYCVKRRWMAEIRFYKDKESMIVRVTPSERLLTSALRQQICKAVDEKRDKLYEKYKPG